VWSAEFALSTGLELSEEIISQETITLNKISLSVFTENTKFEKLIRTVQTYGINR
jgi:hypothetical protein